jgi:hypothetical protein
MAKKSITITLYKSELLYDIQDKTYLTGRSRQTGTNHEEVAHMQVNDDDENALQILRSIKNAVSTLKTKLSEFIDSSSVAADNDLGDGAESTYTISLSMPSNYNEATVETIADQAHDYVVNVSVADWFQITNKTDASDYVTKAEANIENLREALNKRVRPTRTAVNKGTETESTQS